MIPAKMANCSQYSICNLYRDSEAVSHYISASMKCFFVGDLSGIASLHSMLGIGAGSILLPPVQTSALGMPLLQGPDGAINLLNNIQVGNWHVAYWIKHI